jgi:uncharacterized membrane protein YkvA (DUF1232 family)
MSGAMKGLMLILIALYVISPVDLCPGPIDDLIVLLIAFVSNRD